MWKVLNSEACNQYFHPYYILATQNTCYRQRVLLLVRNCTVNNNATGMKNMNLNHLRSSVSEAVPLYLLHESALQEVAPFHQYLHHFQDEMLTVFVT